MRFSHHGTIPNPSKPLSISIHNAEYIQHFHEIWRICFEGFLQEAAAGDFIVFAPELLWPEIYYARLQRQADGTEVESGDLWADSLLIKAMAEEDFENAMRSF